jgi:hypothetical protein
MVGCYAAGVMVWRKAGVQVLPSSREYSITACNVCFSPSVRSLLAVLEADEDGAAVRALLGPRGDGELDGVAGEHPQLAILPH